MTLQALINSMRKHVILSKKERIPMVEEVLVADMVTELNQWGDNEAAWSKVVSTEFIFSDLSFLYQHSTSDTKIRSRVISHVCASILNHENLNATMIQDNLYHLSQLGERKKLDGKIRVDDVAPLIGKLREFNPSKKIITDIFVAIGCLQKNDCLEGQCDENITGTFLVLIQAVCKPGIWTNPDTISSIFMTIGCLIIGNHLELSPEKYAVWNMLFLKLLNKFDNANFADVRGTNLLELMTGLSYITKKYILDFEPGAELTLNQMIQKLSKFATPGHKKANVSINQIIQMIDETIHFVSYNHHKFILRVESVQALVEAINLVFDVNPQLLNQPNITMLMSSFLNLATDGQITIDAETKQILSPLTKLLLKNTLESSAEKDNLSLHVLPVLILSLSQFGLTLTDTEKAKLVSMVPLLNERQNHEALLQLLENIPLQNFSQKLSSINERKRKNETSLDNPGVRRSRLTVGMYVQPTTTSSSNNENVTQTTSSSNNENVTQTTSSSNNENVTQTTSSSNNKNVTQTTSSNNNENVTQLKMG